MADEKIASVPDQLENLIFVIRGHRVMLSPHLADLYGVETKVLVQSIKRNIERFPSDFMFQLTDEEFQALRSHFVTSKFGRGGTRYLPYAFTEQGVAMLSSVLRSQRAIEVNIEIMRAFVRLRQLLAGNVELAERLEELEHSTEERFQIVFDAIRQLMTPPTTRKPGCHSYERHPGPLCGWAVPIVPSLSVCRTMRFIFA